MGSTSDSRLSSQGMSKDRLIAVALGTVNLCKFQMVKPYTLTMLRNRKYFELDDRLLVPNRSPSPGFWEMNDLLIHCLNKIYQNITTFMQFNSLKPNAKCPQYPCLLFKKTCWQRFLEVKLGLQTKNWQILCQIHIRSANPIFLIKLISKVDLRSKCLLSLSF